MAAQELARNLHQQEPGRGYRNVQTAGTSNLAQSKLNRQILRLRLVYGLTQAQTHTLAVLVWRAGT